MLTVNPFENHETYADERYDFLKLFEDEKHEVYVDSENYITVGVGFNLHEYSVLETVLQYGFGLDLTIETNRQLRDSIWTITSQEYEATDVPSIQAQLDELMNNAVARDFCVDSTMCRTIFDQLTHEIYEPKVDNFLETKASGYCLPNSKERIVLLSLGFNTRAGETDLLGTNLGAALREGNRANAWFEIRYNSNRYRENGIAKRRYAESSLFGLYNNPNDISDEDFYDVIAMYYEKKDSIFSYERILSENVSNANRDYYDNNNVVQPLEKIFVPIADRLMSLYAKDEYPGLDIDINGEVRLDWYKSDTVSSSSDPVEHSSEWAGTYTYMKSRSDSSGNTNDLFIGMDDKNNYMNTSIGDDVLIGGAQTDIMYAGSGDDVLIGKDGKDKLCGYKGNDTLIGGKGEDFLFGQDDDDVLYGGEGNDTLDGGKGQDRFLGGEGDDTFRIAGSDADFDTFTGDEGYDKILGSKGNDTIRVTSFQFDDSVEEIDGGDGVDTIAGTDGSDIIDLSPTVLVGVEKIEGGGQNDKILLNNNKLESIEKISGGDGHDRIDLSGLKAQRIDLVEGEDVSFNNSSISEVTKIVGGDTGNKFDFTSSTIETIGSIKGGSNDDTLIFDNSKISSIESIHLGSGNDTVSASGADITGGVTIFGEDGEDTIEGSDNNDTLYGGDNKDSITGGAGADHLYGGRGFDTYNAGDGDTIEDSHTDGTVHFGGITLNGGEQEEEGSNIYIGTNGEKYELKGGTLIVKKDGETLKIEKYTENALNIYLKKKKKEEDESFSSPLVLDLNGNGTTSVSMFDTTTYFDLNGDGFRERTGWAEAGDGILALDRDANGVIDSGNELFGNHTKNNQGEVAQDGFQALSEHDGNYDGVIDKKDAVFSSLKVWTDTNQDGISQADELKTLSELNIESINLGADEISDLEEFNNISHASTFTQKKTDAQGELVTDADGQVVIEEKAIKDVWFLTNGKDTQYDFEGEVSEEILAMPEIKGTGIVKNLSHAMSEDDGLKASVTDFVSAGAGTLSDIYDKAEELLAEWTHTDGIDPDKARGIQNILNHNYDNPEVVKAFRVYAYERDISILERFDGEEFRMVVDGVSTRDVMGTQMAEFMAKKYDRLKNDVVIAILGQSLFGKGVYDVETGELVKGELYAQLENELKTCTDSIRLKGVTNLFGAMLNRYNMAVFDHMDASVLNVASVQNLLSANNISLAVDSEGNVSGRVQEKVFFSDGDDHISGSAGRDVIYGGAGNDIISGGNDHDIIYGGAGDDIIDGGSGSDILYGGDGNDTLKTGGGYGHDILVGGHGDDTLTGSKRSSTYVYTYGDGHDTIIDSGQVGNTGDRIEFNGIYSEDIMVERSGNDLTLYIRDAAGDAHDYTKSSIKIVNAFGKGKIESFAFEDKTITWDELLVSGGMYDDEYTYNLSDGVVSLHDADGTDKLIFGEGITSDMLVVKAVNGSDNLVIALKEEGKAFEELSHRITIENSFRTHSALESFVFADGSSLSLDQVLALQQGTDGDDYIMMSARDSVVAGGGGDDVIVTSSGNDTLDGGAGDDRLEGGTGGDTYLFGRGGGHDDVADYGDDGQDTLQFGAGISTDDIIVMKENDDIIIGLKEEGVAFSELQDTITLRQWYKEKGRIEYLEFSDGTILGISGILNKIADSGGVVYGLETDDVIDGTDDANIIFALGGNDTVSGQGGDDLLHGGMGNDTLKGNAGNDTLEGGQGNDRYVFNVGDGHDTVNDEYRTGYKNQYLSNGGNDTLELGEGISLDDLIVVKEGNDIIIGLKEEGKSFEELADTLTLKDWYNGLKRIENIVLSDGSTLTPGELVQYVGTDGNDEVKGIETASVFEDRAGNDTYVGANGNDTYRFGGGSGEDRVIDGAGADRLVFAEGIAPEDLHITWLQGLSDIQITYNGNDGDSLVLTNWYRSQNRIETFEFADGTVWDASQVVDHMATDSDDVYNGLVGVDNILNTGGGDDLVSTYAGQDQLYGGAGNDALDSQDGDDLLHGGTGDDMLWGGTGDDIYLFNRGDGHDTIYDHKWSVDNAGNDTLKLGTGIERDDLIFYVDPGQNDLCIGIRDSAHPDTPFDQLADVITITDWYKSKNRIETIVLSGTGEQLSVSDVMASMATDGDDTLRALYEGSTLDGGTGDDRIVGNTGSDTLSGGIGDDTLSGSDGDDALRGGRGNDTLAGGAGNDTYYFDSGDGVDVIDNYDKSRTRHDVVVFGQGITSDDVEVNRSGDDLVLRVGGSDDRLVVSSYFLGDGLKGYAVDEIRFQDGTSWDVAQVKSLVLQGSDLADELTGFDVDDQINGLGGDDQIIAKAGNDTLQGGTGNDILNGGAGSDTYIFSLGDGQDRIFNYDHSYERLDVIELSEGISQDDVRVKRAGDDLVLDIGSAGDRITVDGFFRGDGLSGYAVDEVRFSDGSGWSIEQVKALAVLGTDGEDSLLGYFGDDLIKGFGGNDTLKGNGGNDTIYGGADNDTIFGGDNDDHLLGESGNDQLEGGYGTDTLEGGEGEDTLLGGHGDDTLQGGLGTDLLRGGEGSDTLDGGDGDDTLFASDSVWDKSENTLTGGRGNDTLYGSYGSDTYVFNLGDGNDVIYEITREEAYSNVVSNDDTLRFGPGIVPGDMSLIRRGDDLFVTHSNGTDSMKIVDWFRGDNPHFKIELFAFEDGTQWDVSEVESRVVYYGTDGDDVQFGYLDYDDTIISGDGKDYSDGQNGNDSLFGGAGDDTLKGGDGTDRLEGGEDNDLLEGGGGDDTLIGGSGKDQLDGGAGTNHLRGGEGDDKYVYRTGSGIDVIDNSDGGTDWLLFTDDFTADRLTYHKEGDDLVVRVDNDTNHQVIVTDWFKGEEYQLAYIQPSGGNGIPASRINRMFAPADGEPDGVEVPDESTFDALWHGTSGGEQLLGTAGADLIRGYQGEDLLFAQGGDDWLLGGSGNDQLNGEAGNDHLIGGAGDDKYVFGPGFGQDVIDNSGGGTDWILFTGGLTQDKLIFVQDGDNLVIQVKDSTDQVTVKDWFKGDEYRVDYIQPDGGYGIPASSVEGMLQGDPGGDEPGEEGIPSEDTFDTVKKGTEAGEQLTGTSGADLLKGLDGDDQLFSFAGNDWLVGGKGNDYLDAGEGDDHLLGGEGNDQLGGEAGADELIGGIGDDKYVYKAGGGQDTIDNTGGGYDGVFFTEGIGRDRLTYSRDNDDLLITLDGDAGNSVRVKNHFLGGDWAIDYVQPDDGGALLTGEDIEGLIDGGSSGGDTPPGPQTGGDDTLTGSAAAEILVGGAGNDTLVAGGGNDLLIGGAGDDAYVFSSGAVVIDSTGGGTDTLRFAGGITFSQVGSGLTKSGDDLILNVSGTSDQVILKGFFLGGDNLVETIAFDTGGQITADQVFGAFGLAVPTPPAGFDQTVSGTTGNDPALDGGAGRDLIQGGTGDDTLNGQAADDRLEGGSGNDTLRGGLGNDVLVGGRGDDTYRFAAGDGQDVIDGTGGGVDTLEFEGIDFNQVASGLSKYGDDLILNVSGSTDKVTLKDFFKGGDAAIDTVRFASGGSISKAQIFGAFGLSDPDPQGSPVYAGLPDERSYGTVVAASSESHRILGSSDDDFLDGGSGDDHLIGNGGNDCLLGGDGNDTYHFAAGDGSDLIFNQSGNSAGDTDTLVFEGGITKENLWFSQDGDNLVIDVIGSEDQVVVSDWYDGDAAKLDDISTAGFALASENVATLVNAMAQFGAPPAGNASLPQAVRDELAPVLAVSWQAV